jgi:leader peptidase (prepilin peptidase)/N-methyltransferase
MAIGTEVGERTDAARRRARIAPDLPAAAVLSVVALLAVAPSALLLGALYVAAVTGALVRIDVESHRLPNRLVLPGYVVSVAGITAQAFLSGTHPIAAVVAGAAWFFFFLVLNVGGGMGMGDVKLAGLLGLCLGSIGVAHAVAGLALVFLFGGAAGILVLVRRVGGTLTRIPFGPFLLAGYWVTLALTPTLTMPTH